MEKEIILRKVKNVLEQVRPYLQQDGGDVNFVELTDDNTVIVELTGAPQQVDAKKRHRSRDEEGHPRNQGGGTD
jgi:hypothetical protein